MKTFLRNAVLSAGLVLGLAAQAPAQLSVTIGNPYTGQGISIGTPAYGYSSGYSNYAGYGPGLGYYNNTNVYSNTGYLAGPGVIGGRYGYSSGYAGYAGAPIRGGFYGNRPYYGNYGYGSRYGASPFRGVNRFLPFR